MQLISENPTSSLINLNDNILIEQRKYSESFVISSLIVLFRNDELFFLFGSFAPKKERKKNHFSLINLLVA